MSKVIWMPVVVPTFQDAPLELQAEIRSRMELLLCRPYPAQAVRVSAYLFGLRLLENVYIHYEVVKRNVVVSYLAIIPGEIYQP